MLGRLAAAGAGGLAALALAAGCAWISGPCELNVGEQRAACERGGWLIMWKPAETIRAAREGEDTPEPLQRLERAAAP